MFAYSSGALEKVTDKYLLPTGRGKYNAQLVLPTYYGCTSGGWTQLYVFSALPHLSLLQHIPSHYCHIEG